MSDEDARDWRVSRISPLDLGIEVAKDSVDSLAVVGVVRLAHKLHVFPRHRLLLQPHGFEGLVVLNEVLGQDDAALTEGGDFREMLLSRDTAVLTADDPAE